MVEKALIFYRKYIKHKPYGWSGDYSNWQSALQQCTGYDAAIILDKVRSATLKVKNGEAVYEKDSVLFDKPAYSYPLLAAVLWMALKNDGKLSVVDFGGSLGSTYFQNKRFLDDIKQLQWNVIEQPNFVATGQENIQDDRISFSSTIGEALTINTADLLLIACAIQYMQDPYELLENILQFNFRYILIDNTPYNFEARNRITVQKVPPPIYAASYPCWFLDYQQVIRALSNNYTLISEHVNEDIIELDGRQVPYKGFLMELKK